MDPSPPTTMFRSSARLRRLFERIVDLAPPARESASRAAGLSPNEREALAAMIEADRGDDAFFALPAAQWAEQLDADPGDVTAMIGSRVGPYTLVSLLGQGGSSIVFAATRRLDDVDQVVALKLLTSGLFSPESRRRFRREQRILLQLNHPSIARLIDGGISEAGIPYIAVECVDGVEIVEYARSRALDRKARMRLLEDLCRAVDAAHRALIVHRDLKPANVLVTADGSVKVLDFGIAKLVDGSEPATATRSMALTPGYAAPEQYASGAVTTSADVYALGVIAAELLIAARIGPDATFDAQDAQARTRWRRLDADLRHLLRTALATNPDRRYSSAGHLADDVARYSRGEPIAAHRPSIWYDIRKFVCRHRGAASIAGSLGIGILLSLGLAAYQGMIAHAEARRAMTVRSYLLDVLGSASANLPADQRPTTRQIVDSAIKRIDDAREFPPAVRADLLGTLGRVSYSFAEYDRAVELLRRALDETRSVRAPDSTDVVDLHAWLGNAYLRADRPADAAAMLRPLHDVLLHIDRPDAVEALKTLSDAESRDGDDARSQVVGDEVIAKASRIFAPGSREWLETQIWYAEQFPGSKSRRSVEILEPAIVGWRKAHLPENIDLAHALGAIAIAKMGVGDYVHAETRFREAVAMYRRIVEGPHDQLAWQLEGLGNLMMAKGEMDEAESLLKEANDMQRKVVGDQSISGAYSTTFLAWLELARRRFDAAERHGRDVLALCKRVPRSGEPCPDAYSAIAYAMANDGRSKQAEAMASEAVRIRESLYGADHPALGLSLVTLAYVRLAQHRWVDALTTTERALPMIYVQRRSGVPLARWYRARALRELGRTEEALADIRTATDQLREQMPFLGYRLVPMLAMQAQMLHDIGRNAESRQVATEALDVRTAEGLVAPDVLASLRALARK